MRHIGKIGVVLGVIALGLGAFGASVSFAGPDTPSGTTQTGLFTTGLGI